MENWPDDPRGPGNWDLATAQLVTQERLDLVRRVLEMCREYEATYGRFPTVEQVAAEIGIERT